MALDVIRMKRKAIKEPTENLVIALKRPKVGEEERKVHLKLAATLDEKAIIDRKQICTDVARAKLREEDYKISPKCISKSKNSLPKRRQGSSLEQKKKRSQMFDQCRLVLSDQDQKDHSSDVESKLSLNVYDVVEDNEADASIADISCSEDPLYTLTETEGEDYVYDMYYIADGDLDDSFTEDCLSIEPYEAELVASTEDEESDSTDNEDDSNEENNSRTDYPDEEPAGEPDSSTDCLGYSGADPIHEDDDDNGRFDYPDGEQDSSAVYSGADPSYDDDDDDNWRDYYLDEEPAGEPDSSTDFPDNSGTEHDDDHDDDDDEILQSLQNMNIDYTESPPHVEYKGRRKRR